MAKTSLRRSKAEMMDLVTRIVSMYDKDHMTLQQIEETLRGEGYHISREAIRLSIKKNKTIARDLEKTRIETQQLIDTIRSNPSADINEATADFLIAKAFEFTKQIEYLDFENLPQLADFIKKMTKVKTDIVKQRMDYQTVYNRAKEDIMAELKKALEGAPEIYEKLFNLISAMEAPCE